VLDVRLWRKAHFAPQVSRSSLFLRQGEDGAGRGNAAQEMFAERNQCRCRLSGNCAGDQHTAAEGAAQTFESANQIDCRTDRGEVQPDGGADIAPQHFAEMKGQAELQGRQALPAACLVEMDHASLRRADGVERGVACNGRGPFADRENSQHAVADEFQHLAAERVNGSRDAVEPGVQHRHHRPQ